MIRDIIKDIDEPLDEETHSAGTGRAPRAGASVPHGVGACHLPSTWMRSLTCKLSEVRALGIFMEDLSCRHDQLNL